MRALVAVAAGLVVAAAVFVAIVVVDGGRSAPGASAVASAPGDAAGRRVFAAMGCGSCHRLAAAGSRGEIGPDLDRRLPGHTRASLRAKIVSPGRDGFAGMPDDFAQRMSERELSELVEFLVSATPR